MARPLPLGGLGIGGEIIADRRLVASRPPRISRIAIIPMTGLDFRQGRVSRLEAEADTSPEAIAFIPSSDVLQRLHDEAPTDHFTVGWLMGSLRKRSFGIIMLLLALVAMAPSVSIVAGLLLMIPAFQMIAGRPAPVFPRRIAAYPLPARHLAALVQRAVPVLRYLEKMIHPRWPTPLEATKRLVGIVVVILNTSVVRFDPPEQRRPRPRDRPDLAGLSRGGRPPAVDRPAGRRHRVDGRSGGGLGDGPRRAMDQRPLVAHHAALAASFEPNQHATTHVALCLIVPSYVILTHVVKTWFIRRFGLS